MSQAHTLILVEHDRGQLKRPSLHAISAARQLGDPFSLLAIGSGLDEVAGALNGFGTETILLADHPALAEPLADRYARVMVDAVRYCGARALVAVSSTFAKDLLPRTAALLDAPMLSDLIGIERSGEEVIYRRPIQAGNLIASVRLVDSPVRVLGIRATAFASPARIESKQSRVERIAIDAASLPAGMAFISREQRDRGHRPDLSEARVVVAGGRPLKDKATFDRLIGGLADALGGAVASTRAAVDAGIASNDTQVGQTGRVIAPQLYIGAGISGAIQHLAGVQDSRVIVAINKDPDAPIFQAATYGLVGDLHQLIPQLTAAIQANDAATEVK